VDPKVNAAARALAVFDPLTALSFVALREDPPSLALRGIAMAQLADFKVARKLLERAAREFGTEAPLERARCIAAAAEIALTCRDLAAAGKGFAAALRVLAARGDVPNAVFVRLQQARRLVLLGALSDAETLLTTLDLRGVPVRLVALAELVRADVAVRRIRPREARASLMRAHAAARLAGIPALVAEVKQSSRALDVPVAIQRSAGTERALTLDDVAALASSKALVVDACRREIRSDAVVVSLSTRPVLLSLAVALAEAFPDGASREDLVRRGFGARAATESYRARLRVELGRLRKLLAGIATISATPDGFALTPERGAPALALLPPTPGESSALVALLAGGESWSTSGLAAAIGKSQRAVQRALSELEADGRVQGVGRGRARRWVGPLPGGFATTLLLATERPRR
jgi:hypothetical protein